MRVIRSALTVCTIAMVGVTASQPRDAHADNPRWTQLDLQPHANQRLVDDFLPRHYAGDNFSEFEQGKREFEGVPFHVGEKLIQAAGKFIPDHPVESGPIEVDRYVKTLYILHGARWGAFGERGDNLGHWVADGTPIGYYEVVYEDNDARAIPIVYGEDVRDWWSVWDDERPTKRSVVAWTGNNPHLRTRGEAQDIEKPVRLYLTTWKNPRPNARITGVTMHSLNQTAAPFCMAMTARNGVAEIETHVQALIRRRDFLSKTAQQYNERLEDFKTRPDGNDGESVEIRAKFYAGQLEKSRAEIERLDREIKSLEDSEVEPRQSKLKPSVTFAVHAVVADEGENTISLKDPDTDMEVQLRNPPIVSAENVTAVEIVADENGGASLNVTVDDAGAKKLMAATAEPGGRLAIVVNGEIAAAPTVRSRIGAKFRVVGAYERADWEAIIE